MPGQRRPALLLLLIAFTAVWLWGGGAFCAQSAGVDSVSPAPPPPPLSAAEEAGSLAEEIGGGRVAALIERFTYAAIILVLLLCGMGLPLPEEVPILTSAILAQAGHLDPWWGLGACMFGVMLGDSIMFFLGRRWGTHVLDHRLSRKLLTAERQKKIEKYFARYGAWMIFAARFLPGIRAPLFLSAGTMRVSFWKFFAMDGAAALVSIPLSFWLAFVFTDKLEELLNLQHSVHYWAFGALAVGMLVWAVLHWLGIRRRNRKSAAAGKDAGTDAVAAKAAAEEVGCKP